MVMRIAPGSLIRLLFCECTHIGNCSKDRTSTQVRQFVQVINYSPYLQCQQRGSAGKRRKWPNRPSLAINPLEMSDKSIRCFFLVHRDIWQALQLLYSKAHVQQEPTIKVQHHINTEGPVCHLWYVFMRNCETEKLQVDVLLVKRRMIYL